MTLTSKRYIFWTKITLYLVFFLILVGGIVRATGSGLGCPDWPKCFGHWVPPTHISELPADYKEIFKVAGKEIADFDPMKTWTEYINRLIGVLIGMAIFAMAVLSKAYWRRCAWVFYGSWFAFLLVGFQGWVGALVVKSYLAGYMITIHMFLALLLVCLIMALLRRAQSLEQARSFYPSRLQLKPLQILFWAASLQLLIGTQVREVIDHVARTSPDLARADWPLAAGAIFLIHRSFSLVLLAMQVWLWRRGGRGHVLHATFILTLLSGVGLAYLGFPAWLQPVHLLAALVLVTLYFDQAYLNFHQVDANAKQ